jgi:hypothetical protein
MPLSPECRDTLFVLDHELGDLRQVLRVTYELGEKALRLQPALVEELLRAQALINQALTRLDAAEDSMLTPASPPGER